MSDIRVLTTNYTLAAKVLLALRAFKGITVLPDSINFELNVPASNTIPKWKVYLAESKITNIDLFMEGLNSDWLTDSKDTSMLTKLAAFPWEIAQDGMELVVSSSWEPLWAIRGPTPIELGVFSFFEANTNDPEVIKLRLVYDMAYASRLFKQLLMLGLYTIVDRKFVPGKPSTWTFSQVSTHYFRQLIACATDPDRVRTSATIYELHERYGRIVDTDTKELFVERDLYQSLIQISSNLYALDAYIRDGDAYIRRDGVEYQIGMSMFMDTCTYNAETAKWLPCSK